MAEEFLYLTELLGLKVFDLRGRKIGTLRDAALVPLVDSFRVDRYLVGAGPGWLSVRHDQIRSISLQGIHLKDERLTPYHSDEYMLRMVRDLLDQQIIDAQGRKVVRVNDVTFELRQKAEDQQALYVLEVDIGVRSIVRRVLQGAVPSHWIRAVQAKIPPNSIRWEFCNVLEPDPQRRVRLNISNRLLEAMHPADLADIVEELSPEDRHAIFSTINSEVAAEALTEVHPGIQARIIESLKVKKAAEILEEMEPNEVADVLSELEAETSEGILEEMAAEDKQEVEELLELKEKTAGRLMLTEFLSFSETSTVADAIDLLRKHEEQLDSIYALFLVDAEEHLVCSVSLARLFLASGGTLLKDLAFEPQLSVDVHEKQDRVAEIFDKYNLLMLPVVDEQKKLVGAIAVDDIVNVLRQN